jgi:hypothetical protein
LLPPPTVPLVSIPVSFPLIGLTQHLVTARVSGLSPAELSACFSGTSGHSQCLVTAVVTFSSKDDAPSSRMYRRPCAKPTTLSRPCARGICRSGFH